MNKIIFFSLLIVIGIILGTLTQNPPQTAFANWSKDWTHIVSFTLNGSPYLIEDKNGDGTVAIDKVNSNGIGTKEIWRSQWTTGYKHRTVLHRRITLPV